MIAGQGSESLETWLLERSMFLFCSQCAPVADSNAGVSAPSGFCRPAASDCDRGDERRGLVTVDETERADDGTGQD
jgi:hypothetical protein